MIIITIVLLVGIYSTDSPWCAVYHLDILYGKQNCVHEFLVSW